MLTFIFIVILNFHLCYQFEFHPKIIDVQILQLNLKILLVHLYRFSEKIQIKMIYLLFY